MRKSIINFYHEIRQYHRTTYKMELNDFKLIYKNMYKFNIEYRFYNGCDR